MEVIAAYDNDPDCVATYNANWNPVARLADLSNWKTLDIPDCDGIIAGPPCQGASKAIVYQPNRKVFAKTYLNALYLETARIAIFKRVAWVIIENVEGMIRTPEFKNACQELMSAGYWTTVSSMIHAAYGGLTIRKRYFLVAAKRMLMMPSPTHRKREWRAHGTAIEPLLKIREPDGIGGWKKAPIDLYLGDASWSQNWGSWRCWRRWDEPFMTILRAEKSKNKSFWRGEWFDMDTETMACLQGFPTSFKNLNSSQVGNSVPPEFAQTWGNIIRQCFGNNQHIVSLFCGAGGFDFVQES
jgi:site-specific DNA-cytosine methylase